VAALICSEDASEETVRGSWSTSDRRRHGYLYGEEINRIEKVLLSHDLAPYPRERNALLVRMLYEHGLRASEAAELTWDQLSLERRTIWIERRGRGTAGEQRLTDAEVSYLSSLKERLDNESQFLKIFGGEMDSTSSVFGLSPRAIHQIIELGGKLGKVPFPVSPSMLRHSCGHHLAENQKDPITVMQHLGFRSLQSTARYFSRLHHGIHSDSRAPSL
jgi:type 1 fimbriae regulatory protein FimB/type 1 fimbriae regulatory protein FimE